MVFERMFGKNREQKHDDERDLDDEALMQDESRQAVREGNALPLPAVAAEDAEMRRVLMSEIERLDDAQLETLLENLHETKTLLSTEKQDVTHDIRLTPLAGIVPGVAGYIIGNAPGAAIGAAGGMLIARAMNRKRLCNINERIQRIIEMIDAVKKERRSATTSPDQRSTAQ